MDTIDVLPFSVISFGHNQVLAFLPDGADGLAKMLEFAEKYPDAFRKFFPTVTISELLRGGHALLNEPPEDESDADTSPDVVTPDVHSEGSDDDRAATLPRSVPWTPRLLAEFRAAKAARQGQPLRFCDSLRFKQCSLHQTYPVDYRRRATNDRMRLFSWDPTRAIPADPHKLVGAAYRAFLTAQGIPLYVSPTRIDPDFEPRRMPAHNRRASTTRRVLGGDFLWALTRNMTEEDLIYSTMGTTVVPELGKIYTFDELYPDPDAGELDASSSSSSFNSSPVRHLLVCTKLQ
ncbi:hypothetical protein BD626DRAFT_537756 [Schizophyllum amplum]|uniref:Uncharacterized protein n=1 Tax=Schizophyllum amplum TaxID=97359 RepID=A0A550CB11_9AGAR|nr:hypothetical protein BD626DRAFT_537756 [Auriculariopsis ampla]